MTNGKIKEIVNSEYKNNKLSKKYRNYMRKK